MPWLSIPKIAQNSGKRNPLRLVQGGILSNFNGSLTIAHTTAAGSLPILASAPACVADIMAIKRAIHQPARRFSALWRLMRDHLHIPEIAAILRAELAALTYDAEASAVEHLARQARAALDDLSAPVWTVVEPPTPPATVRLDPELGRLALGLHLGAQLRLWAIARHLSTTHHIGRGWVSLPELRAELDRARSYSDRHLRRLLRAGHGLFWQYTGHRVYLAGVQKLSAALAQRAATENPALIETNMPGRMKDVYLPVDGPHEQWESLIYAGWLAAKADPTIARDTLEMLFNRSSDTLIRWERDRLAGVVTVTPGFAQVMADDTLDAHTGDQLIYTPEGTKAYEDRAGALYLRWQIPNTYHSSIRQHNHKGQGRKVRRAVAASLAGEPLEVMDEGQPRNPRRYYEDRKRLKTAIRRHGVAVRYLFLGVGADGRYCWEPTVSSPYTRTRAGARWVAA